MRTSPLCVLFLAATHSLSSAFLVKNNKAIIWSAKWQPLKAEALQDAVQDAFTYFSQLPPEQVRNDVKQRGEWYELAQFPTEVSVTPQTSVKGCSSPVSIQTGLYQENGQWIIFRFQGDTDATVLRGLIQILSDITQDVPIDEVLSLPPYEIGNVLGLQSTLSQSDSNNMGAVWSALQQQIQETLYGNNEESDYEPSTMGTSIPGAGSSKPAVKKGWSPGSGSNSQSSTSGSAPPFAIWDPTSASTQSAPSPSPPSSSPSDRLSRLDRLSSPSNAKFADGAEVDASANKAPWDNWVPPPPQNSQTASSDGPSTLGTSIPGAGSSKPATKKGWGPGSSTSSDNTQSNASGSAPPFAIWDPTSASTQSSPSPSPPSSSPSDRLSRLDRLSSPSTPKFADGTGVDATASKAPWDNWVPPPPQNLQSFSSDAPSTMGTSIPGSGSALPAVKKGWGPGSGTSSSNENKQSSTSGSAPPFAIWDPTNSSAQSSPSPSPPSSSPSDRLSRLDRLSSTSTPKFADGAQVDTSASKAPWENWTPPSQKTDNAQSASTRSDNRSNGTSSSSERLSRLDRTSSSSTNYANGAQFESAASTPSSTTSAERSRRNSASNAGRSVASSDTEPPLGPAFGIETAPKSLWKSDPSSTGFKPLTSSERPPWENEGSSRSPQSSLNPLSGKVPEQRWNESPTKRDILQPQEVTSSSFRASSYGSSGNFVQNSKKVYDSIPKNDTTKGSSLGPDFVESDRYKIKNPADSSRSVPSTPWRTPSGSSADGARLDPLYPNSPSASSVWKGSDGIDPLPFTPKNLQTPGVSSGNNPFSPAGVGPQNTFSSTPWTGSTPSTAGAERVTLQPQNFSPASGTMSSWTGSTPSRGSPVGPFQDNIPWGPQNGRTSWEPSAFPTKLGDFTTEVNRKPRNQSVRGPGYRSVNQRDGPPSGFKEREPYRGRPEGYAPKESTQANTSFDAEVLKDIGKERRSRGGSASESRGASSGPFADRDAGRSSHFGQAESKVDSLTDESVGDRASSTNFRKKNRPSGPRTYLDIITGNYERATTESQSPGPGDKDYSGPPLNGASSRTASKSTTRAAPGNEADRFRSEPRGPSTPKTPFRGAEQGTRNLNEPGYDTLRVPLNEDGPRSPFRGVAQGARDLNEPGYESRRPPFGGAGQSARGPNETGYETRRSPFNENVSRSRSEGYRSPPRRPDQKPYVDRIIPTRPYSNEGPPYSPYEGGRVNDDRWQQRGSRIPPPGSAEYYDYREGPRRPEDERFRYRDDNAWRSPGPGLGPGNGPYDDRMRPRDMMPPRN